MIKLKDILLESTAPDIFIPRRIEGRVERLIRLYVKNGSKGNLSLNKVGLTKLPDILKDITVGESFDCSYNNLTSLEGSPSSVGGNFGCGFNNLTSLEGSPSSVGGSFYCGFNNLTSLEGAPKTVGGSFICGGNNLTSLEGAPKSVGLDFYCTDNPVQFTRKGVKSVCNVKGRIFV
jgi:hypothetical protein